MEYFVLEADGGNFLANQWAYSDKVQPTNLGPATKCEVCGGYVTLLKWLPPHTIRLSSSKPEKWPDFLWTIPSSFMVSSKAIRVFRQRDLRIGALWRQAVHITSFGNVRAERVEGRLPRYHLIDMDWEGAVLDDEASEVKRPRRHCSYCGSSYTKFNRIALRHGSWKGDDVFEARGLPGQILVTERFRDTVLETGLTNADCIPIAEFTYDELKLNMGRRRQVSPRTRESRKKTG